MSDVVGALRAEVERVGRFLDSIHEQDWVRPTRCPPMRVHELAAHALRGVIRIEQMFAAGAVDAEPEKDGATYFNYGPNVADDVVERSFAAAKEFPIATLPGRWRDEWGDALERVESTLVHDDPVLPGVFGLIKLSEYMRTRVVEVVIHHMDIRDALGNEPDPDPAALDAVCSVLSELLGTDPRVLGMDGVRFALIGTGRAALNDREHAMLGPLSERIPVLS